MFRFRVAVAVVVAVEECSTEEADVEILTIMCLEHAVMSAARSVETLFEAHNFMKQCVQRQQGCLQCCGASCRLRVESTVEVVHKSAVTTRCVSEQKENIERCRLFLVDSQSQVCLDDGKERAEMGAELIPVSTAILPESKQSSRDFYKFILVYINSSREKSCRDFEKASSLLEDS